MSLGSESRSPFQLINDHIKSLEQSMNKIDEQQKHLDKLKVSAEEDIYRQYDSLVNAIKKSHIETAKQLEELYLQQKQKLDAARERLIDRKTKAETELIVDHKPVEMPEVSLNCTVNILKASQAIGRLKLSMESGEANFITLLKQELKAKPASVGGFSFPFLSTSSDPGFPSTSSDPGFPSTSSVHVSASVSTVRRVVPPQSVEATRKRKRKQAAAKIKRPLHPLTPKMTIHNVRDFIRCIDCRKPRCVYSSKKLTKDDKDCWNSLKDILPYRCGANLFPTQPLAVELTDCSMEVNYQYFSHERKFPAVCYNCGTDIVIISSSSSSSIELVNDGKQPDLIVHDVCQSCKDQGIKPRTKKKPASKKQSNSNLLF